MLLLSALITTYIIENTLLRQKVNQSIEDVYEYSVNLSNDMNNKDAETLYKSTVAAGKEYGCRVLIVNTGGVVIVDSYSTMNGVKLNAREVLEAVSYTHLDVYKRQEPDCAVKKQLEAGEISPERYERYKAILYKLKERRETMYD